MLCLNLLINTDPSISWCPTHPFSHLKITPCVAWWGKSRRWYGAIFNWGKKAEPEPSTEDNDRGKTALCLPWARGNYGGALLRGYYCRLKWCRSPWLSQMSPLGGGKWEDLPSSRSSISLPLFSVIPAGFWQQRGAAPGSSSRSVPQQSQTRAGWLWWPRQNEPSPCQAHPELMRSFRGPTRPQAESWLILVSFPIFLKHDLLKQDLVSLLLLTQDNLKNIYEIKIPSFFFLKKKKI